ncbi:MAG: TolC family protein, partial [Spirochaetia bacterium]|nr:TolC family protein [Spirochaetia bacterium]
GGFIYQDIDVNTDNEFSFGLSLNQQIFNMKVFNAIKASREFKLMSSYIYDIQNQTVITLAKKVYYQNVLLEKLLDVKIEVEENSRENYLNIKKKFENGLVSQFELLRSEVDWKMKIPETTQARKNLDLAKINLKNLAGIQLDDEVLLISDINDYPAIPEIVPISDILKERPDYKSLVREMSLREINIKAAMSDHYPTVSGNIMYGVSTGSDDFSLDSDKTTITQIGIKVSLPIYSGGALSAQDRKAKSEFEQTEIKLDQLTENIMSEINSIYLTLRETNERIESASATMETAQQAYEIAQTSFDSGMATQLDLKDASLSLELAKINHISAIYEYLAASFDWDMAIGKAAAE